MTTASELIAAIDGRAGAAGDVRARSVDLTNDDAGAQLNALLGLVDVGMTLKSAVTTGQGARASAQLELSNGEWLEFDSLREMAHPTVLKAELAACAGATPKITAADAITAVALLRQVARRQQTMTDDDHATDWGVSYLQSAQERGVDMRDQAERWAAFCDLRSLDNARDEAGGGMTMVLLDGDGIRYVRTGHFFPFVRAREPGMSEARIAQRMLRAGWSKRNQSGRIKATRPGIPGPPISWAFFTVPEPWPGSEVTAGVDVMRAREEAAASRDEGGTRRNRGTGTAT